jgi:hypothetical protein
MSTIFRRDPLVPPSPEEWAEMASTVLVATRLAYTMTRHDGFDKLDDESKAGLAAAIANANEFYRAMARITGDALALTT